MNPPFLLRMYTEDSMSPKAESETKVASAARIKRGGLRIDTPVRNQANPKAKITTPLINPMKVFHVTRPRIIQIRGEGAARVASIVPFQRSKAIELPEPYTVVPHIPIIPPPRTA